MATFQLSLCTQEQELSFMCFIVKVIVSDGRLYIVNAVFGMSKEC